MALRALLHNLEAIFLNHGVGEDFFGDALELRLRFVAVPAVEIEDEEFALAYVGNLRITQARKGVLNSLSLRIEHGSLWHYPNVSFHAPSITLTGAASVRPRVQATTYGLFAKSENAKKKLFATS